MNTSLVTDKSGWAKVEISILVLFVTGLIVLSITLSRSITARQVSLSEQAWMDAGKITNVEKTDHSPLNQASVKVEDPEQSSISSHPTLSSELRVVAIGSGYPIPFNAETCTFTDTPQPQMSQLDWDGDGITDDWELQYGLDKLNRADASLDNDSDGFTNIEEFLSETDPTNAASRPPYVTKLRLKKVTGVDFRYIFQGVTEFEDKNLVIFQLYDHETGKSFFKGTGEEFDGIIVKSFMPKDAQHSERLVVQRGKSEIVLPKRAKVADPESRVELINMLDQKAIMTTMGALLSLRNDVYMVEEVSNECVKLRDQATGKVYNVDSLTEEGR